MTEAEVAELLAFCAGYDPALDAAAALAAWHDSLSSPWVPNLGLEEAQCAVVRHYRRTPVRVQPADVLRLVRDDRAAMVARVVSPTGYGVPPNDEYRAARAELERKLAAARKVSR